MPNGFVPSIDDWTQNRLLRQQLSSLLGPLSSPYSFIVLLLLAACTGGTAAAAAAVEDDVDDDMS